MLSKQVGGIKCTNDTITHSNPLHPFTNLDYLTGGVRAWDHAVFDGEGVLGRGDCYVAEVGRDGMDLDQDFMLGWLWDWLVEGFQVTHGGSLSVDAEDGLGHCLLLGRAKI